PWRLRWTLALVAVVVLMFVAGIAAVGLTHQTIWLMTAPVRLTDRDDFVPRITATNNLREIGFALDVYHDKYQHFPPGAAVDGQGRVLHGWQTQLLPYIGQDELYQRIDQRLPWDHPDNAPHFQTAVSQYQYRGIPPHDGAGYALSHFAGNVHIFGGDAPR